MLRQANRAYKEKIIVIDTEDCKSLKDALNKCQKQVFQNDVCRKQAKKYRDSEKFQESLNLYLKIIKTN